MKTNKKYSQGFTLLELLIVIAILAILSAALVLVLNPAESMKKSRDTQRMSDLSTLKTALGLYLTTVSSPDLDGSAVGFSCLSGATAGSGVIAYSSSVANVVCTTSPVPLPGSDTSATFAADPCYTTAAPTSNDGTGWIPVNFGSISGGSPIASLPLDPINTTIDATPTSADFVYRYACQSTGDTGKPSSVFEIDAVLESAEFATGTSNKMTTDGGDNINYYEVGTSTRLIGDGINF